MYNVLDVSQYILSYCGSKEYMVSNLWLQKILYLAQAYFLLEKNEPCFLEKIEAWDFGPVVPEAYREYKRFAGATIFVNSRGNDVIDDPDKKLINSVINNFAKYSASELTMDQLPWQNAYFPSKHNEITCESLLEYFS